MRTCQCVCQPRVSLGGTPPDAACRQNRAAVKSVLSAAVPTWARSRYICWLLSSCCLTCDILSPLRWHACRTVLAQMFAVPLLTWASFSTCGSAAELPAPPPTGSCTDCIGEFNGTLNDCRLDSLSCVSTQNDDELHFMAPWQYTSNTSEAIDSLVAVATGR